MTADSFYIICLTLVALGLGLIAIELFGRLWDRMFGPVVLRERENIRSSPFDFENSEQPLIDLAAERAKKDGDGQRSHL